MNYSPAIKRSLFTNLILYPVDPNEKAGVVEQVVMYRCGECSQLHDFESDAEDCCPEVIENGEPTNCPVYKGEFSDHHEAVDCCLWKDLDWPTRYRIACRVEAGTTWAEALEITH